MAEDFDIDAQRRLAWRKYYKAEEEIKSLQMSSAQMTKAIHTEYSNSSIEPLARLCWKNARIYESLYTQKHYSQFLCGGKTHMQILKTKDKSGKEISKPYHMTENDEPYKPWKEGDVPSYYMKKYPIDEVWYSLHSDGVFFLKTDILSKMKGKHLENALNQSLFFAVRYTLIPEKMEYIFEGGRIKMREMKE